MALQVLYIIAPLKKRMSRISHIFSLWLKSAVKELGGETLSVVKKKFVYLRIIPTTLLFLICLKLVSLYALENNLPSLSEINYYPGMF